MVWKLFDLPTYFSAEPTTSTKVKYFVTGVVLPCICYLIISVSGTVGVEQPWQSGSPEVYATLLLSRSAVFIFLPLKIFAMAGLIRWLFFPNSRSKLWVRLAVFSGVVLSLQVLILTFFHSGPITLIAGGITGTTLAIIVFFFARFFTKKVQISIARLLLLMAIVAIMIALTIQTNGAWIFFLIFAVPLSAPTLTCLTYMRVAVAIGSQSISIPSPGRLVLSIGALIGAWLVSWRLALNVVMAEYQRLPTTNPNCYISSAAAHGHRHLVRSEIVFTAACESIYVNRQMRLLKFFELTLLCFMPRLHRTLRHIYDRIGPIIAQLCHRSKVVADIAFITLLPLQLVAELLRQFFHISNVDIERFWRSHDSLVDEKAKP